MNSTESPPPIPTLLDCLTRDEFVVKVAFIGGAGALREVLHQAPEVGAIKAALGRGELRESTVKAFIERLLLDLQVGRVFPHDRALAALAVALEGSPSRFANDYISSLAGLNCVELMMSPGVARKCRLVRALRHATTYMLSPFSLVPADTLGRKAAGTTDRLPNSGSFRPAFVTGMPDASPTRLRGGLGTEIASLAGLRWRPAKGGASGQGSVVPAVNTFQRIRAHG